MARRRPHTGWLARWFAPLVLGPTLTLVAVLWLWGSAEREGLLSTRPTMLDFGRDPTPPSLRLPLTADAPPAVQLRTGAAVNDPLLAADKTVAADVAALPPPPAFEASFGRVTVLDATRFKTVHEGAHQTIRLAGLPEVAFSDTCAGTVGRWNCGARARADLARLIGPRAVGCVGLRADEDGDTLADCWVGNRNLAAYMVARGWVEPLDPADPVLAPYAAAARSEHLGRFGDGALPALGSTSSGGQ